MKRVRPSELDLGRGLKKGGQMYVVFTKGTPKIGITDGFMYVHPNLNRSCLILRNAVHIESVDEEDNHNIYKWDHKQAGWIMKKQMSDLKKINAMLKKVNKRWSY